MCLCPQTSGDLLHSQNLNIFFTSCLRAQTMRETCFDFRDKQTPGKFQEGTVGFLKAEASAQSAVCMKHSSFPDHVQLKTNNGFIVL